MSVRDPREATTKTADPEEPGNSAPGQDLPVSIGIGLGFLILYVVTLCPTCWLGDSGEITAAIASGGIIHPPGYPLFGLLGRLALILIPIGEPAFRVGCVTAAAAAACVGVLYLVCRRLKASPLAAFIAAATFGTSYAFWSQSVRVEVYSLHLLLMALSFLFALRYRDTGAIRDICGAAIAVSLGLAHNTTILLSLPTLLILGGIRFWKEPGLPRRLLSAITILLAGPCFHLLNLFWARQEPLENWGRPVTLPALWYHASARTYSHYLRMPTGEEAGATLRRSLEMFWDTFPYFGGFLFLVGIYFLAKRDRTILIALLVNFGLVFAFNLFYRSTGMDVYLQPLWLILTLFLAVAVDAIVREAEARYPAYSRIIAVLLLLLPALQVIRNYAACNLSGATFVRDFAVQKLQSCDPNGILVTANDNDSIPVGYAKTVLGIRPDITHLDRTLLVSAWQSYKAEPGLWYLRKVNRQGADFALTPPGDSQQHEEWIQDGALIDYLERHPERPLFLTFLGMGEPSPNDPQRFLNWAREQFRPLPQGVVLRMNPKDQTVDRAALLKRNKEIWDTIELPNLALYRFDMEVSPEYLIEFYVTMLINYGNLYEINGDPEAAAKVYEAAAAFAPDNPRPRKALEQLRQPRSGTGK